MYGNTRQDAVNEAKLMKKALKNSKGWKTRIWENLGWHASLQKGAMNLYLRNGQYSVLMSETIGENSGSMCWSIDYRSKDPNKVIAYQLRAARAHVLKCLKAIESVDD